MKSPLYAQCNASVVKYTINNAVPVINRNNLPPPPHTHTRTHTVVGRQRE